MSPCPSRSKAGRTLKGSPERTSSSIWSACPTKPKPIRPRSPAGRSNASALRGRSRRDLPCFSDEATSALDPETTRSILALLKDINRRLGLTILLITHEMEVIRSIADRVAVIDAGRIVEEGPVWSVFADPRSVITTSLLATIRPQLPEEIAAGLSRSPGHEAVLRVDIAGDAAGRPLLSDLAAAVPGPFRLVHGGVDHVQRQPVASLFLAVPAGSGHLQNVLDFLTGRGARVEVLGYV